MTGRGSARIAFATCADYADLDPDDRLLLEPLARLGVVAEPGVWDDPRVDWERFDAVLLRSTWDYPARVGAFLDWTAALPRLLNRPDVVRWNVDKRYLLELEAAGVPIVPTRILEPGTNVGILRWPEVVAKPTISVGSRDTARYGRDDPRLSELVARIHADGRTVMLQPYQRAVDADGESALIYIEGRFSHAIRKGPLLRPDGSITDGLFAEEEISPRTPDEDDLAVGAKVVDHVVGRFGAPLYARVDLLPGSLLVEVELVEPSLFLAHGAGAADRFARAIAAAVTVSR